MLAAIRPDDWNLPLLLHVLGAMLLVGGLVTALTALYLGWRRDAAPFTRLGFRTLLLVAFPAWWLMRIPGEWIASKEDFGDEEPGLARHRIHDGRGRRPPPADLDHPHRDRRAPRQPATAARAPYARVGTVLATIVLAAYVVTVWAMSAKPT